MNATSVPDRYKSPEAEARFQSDYENLLGVWDIAFESRWVSTEYGESHLLVAGCDEAPPMVLVPGAQGTSGMWRSIAAALAPVRRLYCLDHIDQVGPSRPRRVLSDPNDSDAWLGQVLDGLGLEHVDLLGNSIGSFICGKYASAYPDRLRSLVLTAPAATVASVSPLYILQVLVSMNLPGVFLKDRFLLRSGAGKVSADDPLFRVLRSAMYEGRVVSKLLPRSLTPTELASLSMPVLLIQGGRDKVNSITAAEVCEKLDELVPIIICENFEDAGHLWAPEHFSKAGVVVRAFYENAKHYEGAS